ncbi:transcription cofactor vestigial-like protein 4 [Scyliorhinus canicula]|uniref:transcription cofactor vestigial-like protein 4 n=1 Tax=Scyliorhinus canicula TaxID=7830 RepID=UPI0018F617C4|nr:transcription cofactor vestigial-like protein 4 [Scyliorhinus canicula]
MEPSSISQPVVERLPKFGKPLALVRLDRPVAGEGRGEQVRRPGLCQALAYSPHKPPQQVRGPPADQPLALIKKRPCSSRANPDPACALPPSMLQQMRPSVITCASSSYRECGHDRTLVLSGHKRDVSVSYSAETEGADRTVTCESVVDEHFRRSLGRDYHLPVGAANSVSISGSVDDHFAKALGEKWLEIKGTGDSSPVASSLPGGGETLSAELGLNVVS